MTERLKVGDRVKPGEDFDFKSYGGPKDPSELGTVTKESTEVSLWVVVQWDNGEENDHSDPAHPLFEEFYLDVSVVKVDA